MKNISENYSESKIPVKYLLIVLGTCFISVIITYYTLRTQIIGASCMTTQQVSVDARCLYIYHNSVYLPPGPPHHGHGCRTDVGNSMPGNHSDGRLLKTSPYYIADICAITPPPNTFFIVNSQTSPFLPLQGFQVLPGTQVTWINQDNIAHSVTEIGYPQKPDSFSSGIIPPGQSFSHTFTYEGKFPFFNENKIGPGFLNVFNPSAPTPSPIPSSNVSIGIYQINQVIPLRASVYTGTTVAWTNYDITPVTLAASICTPICSIGWQATIAPGQNFTKTFTAPANYIMTNGLGVIFNVVNGSPPSSSPTTTFGPISPPVPGNTLLALTLCPHGIGKCGDNANPTGAGNTTPIHTTRSITVSVYNTSNTLVTTQQGYVINSNSGGNFTGTVNIGTIAAGNYLVRITMDGFLQKLTPGAIQVTGTQTVNIPSLSLATGDITNDNKLDILDYNALANCFGSKKTTSSCTTPPTQQSQGADINDNGAIDGIDYNLLLREFSVQSGG